MELSGIRIGIRRLEETREAAKSDSTARLWQSLVRGCRRGVAWLGLMCAQHVAGDRLSCLQPGD